MKVPILLAIITLVLLSGCVENVSTDSSTDNENCPKDMVLPEYKLVPPVSVMDQLYLEFQSNNFGNGWRGASYFMIGGNYKPQKNILNKKYEKKPMAHCREGSEPGENLNYTYCPTVMEILVIERQTVAEDGTINPAEVYEFVSIILDTQTQNIIKKKCVNRA
ncbi:MAG: hypothetical protein QGI60_01650 [archaeon]|nr:hypothetical protein [archaeon]